MKRVDLKVGDRYRFVYFGTETLIKIVRVLDNPIYNRPNNKFVEFMDLTGVHKGQHTECNDDTFFEFAKTLVPTLMDTE